MISFSTYGQKLVECIEFSTTISGSGIIEGGTTYFTKVVLVSKQDDIQIYKLVPEKSKYFKKVELNNNDTLTITYSTFRSHLSSPVGYLITDSILPVSDYSKKGKQKTISFSSHPPEYGFFCDGNNCIKISYKHEEKIYEVILPEETLKEIMRP
jgi:hypothetical protein